uniref:Uncharacterized protein n=1 Tax=Tetraselmis sp. GSL018 TaxID=582737 RepID=A0A061R3C7_9CHLO|eukprot:CAMPEP_0177600304 /NCGR_PEP_ID=MMETSP0419_2-20121207/13543_1 /TAXON_ID=582737 /ORGANISM="Tetraselmis sp., Strain GSL018" /LENGTH=123 /DNA_ID=CAMNT_0019093271 /DNA_START=89 /DNA_END=460 /DNA_ORIENTATION=+
MALTSLSCSYVSTSSTFVTRKFPHKSVSSTAWPGTQRVASRRSPVPRAEGEKKEEPKYIYADEEPEEGFFKRDPMSEEQKKKLRDEYIGFGGSPNQPMAGNYFLNIVLIVGALAILCAALGYI